MEQRYNIRFNLREPSREEIERHMDFDALLQRYQEETPAASPVVPLRRTLRRRYLMGAAATVALLLAAWFLLRGEGEGASSAEEYFAQQPFLNPPLPTLEGQAGAYAAASVDASSGGELSFPNGARLVVPTMAFADDRGEPIDGDVSIYYRELHDYVDFFVAGLPMQYDSAQQRYHFESAGIIDVYAEHNGRRVHLARNKQIQVQFAGSTVVTTSGVMPQLHVYRLDTAARRWEYYSPDQVQSDDASALMADAETARRWQERFEAAAQHYQQQRQALEATVPVPAAPTRPKAVAGKQTTLELDFLDELQLAEGSNVGPDELKRLSDGGVWEITPDSPPVDERAFSVTWEQVRLRRLENDRYELTLIHPQNQERLIVRPALLGADYDKAMARYETELAAYEKALATREVRLANERQQLDAQYAATQAELQQEFNRFINEQDADTRRSLMTRRVQHQFSISQLGIYNCARPVQSELLRLQAHYVDDEGKEIEGRTAYVVNKSQNTVYRYLAADGAELSLNPQTDNLLWIVGTDGRVAVADPAQLRQLTPGQEATIRVRRYDDAPRDEASLRRMLQF